ncbi:MAG TPA: DUF2127 domain-containing protein [Rhizomicrobium sp.]|nr:DUF2127 domain-containing protein [Rhizomicrobium sp.]
MPQKTATMAHRAYLAAIAVKGFDGGIELLLGLVVALLGRDGLNNLLISIVAPELSRHPGSHLWSAVQHGTDGLLHAGHGFVVVYLLAHGALKLAIAIGLFRERTNWIFPVAAVVLLGFIAYMNVHLAILWSWWLFAFMLFDVVTLGLVLNEWRNHRAPAAPGAAVRIGS